MHIGGRSPPPRPGDRDAAHRRSARLRGRRAGRVPTRAPGVGRALMTSSASFYRRAADALADRALQGKVQRATTRLTNGRTAGFAALEGADAVRDHARAIRADVVAHLDRYLATFAERLTALGGHVHWAVDAEDAVRIVADIATSRGVTDGGQVEVDGERGDRAQCRARARRRPRRRDRPRRVGRAARRRPPVAHHRADHPQEPRRRGRDCSATAWARARPTPPTCPP